VRREDFQSALALSDLEDPGLGTNSRPENCFGGGKRGDLKIRKENIERIQIQATSMGDTAPKTLNESHYNLHHEGPFMKLGKIKGSGLPKGTTLFEKIQVKGGASANFNA